MKILQITASYKPAFTYGGPIMSVSMLCEGLAELERQSAESGKQKVESQKSKVKIGKYNLEVFTTTANGLIELSVEAGKPTMIDGVFVTFFKRWTKDHSHFSPGLLLHLNKVLREAQHDNIVIHVHAWWNLVSVLSCWVAKWYQVPVVLSPRGMLNFHTYNTGNRILKKIIHLSIGKKLLQYCSIHATTDKEKAEIIDFIDADYINVIPNLARLGNLKSNNCKQNKKIFEILFLSRINPIKGLEVLFEALARLDFGYRLTIAGSGDENYIKSLKRKVESLKLGDRIKWIGQVGNEEKFKLMAEQDLMVLPSYNENFANVVIESLSVGTPVLISERVGLADYVAVNELGWICSLEPNDIAEKITEAYGAIAKRQKINSTAPFIIEKDFNEEALVGRYLEFYEDILQLSSEYLA